MKKRKTLYILLSLVIIVFIISSVFHERFGFSVDRASDYITSHALERSHNRCALHVALALNAGGQPVPLLRACDYDWYFEKFLSTQFEKVPTERYTPKKGDIVVFPKIRNHPFGHIAIWTGDQWVSDFKQRSVIVSKAYSIDSCSFYRPIVVIQ